MMMLESREKVIIDSEENLHLLPNVPKPKGFLCLPVYRISSGYGKFHYSVVCRLPYYNDREMGMPATCIYMYLYVFTCENISKSIAFFSDRRFASLPPGQILFQSVISFYSLTAFNSSSQIC